MNLPAQNNDIPERFTAKKLAEMKLPGFPRTKSGFTRKASSEKWPFVKRSARGGGKEYAFDALPKNLRIAIIKKMPNLFGIVAISEDISSVIPDTSKDADPNGLWNHYVSRPEKEKKVAQKRLHALNEISDMESLGLARTEAILLVAGRIGFSPSSIYNWLGTVKGIDRTKWLPALLPRWKGSNKKVECSIEAWELFKDKYLRLEKPAAAACYRRLKMIARQKQWQLPSLKYFMRRLSREVELEVIVLAREGEKALDRMYPAQERDKSSLHALERANADGHKFDVFVKWPDGVITRPIGVFFQDIYSGKILSCRVDRTENKGIVRLSFADMAQKYGIPYHVHLDNSRAFASKWITGGVKSRYRFKIKDEEPEGILKSLGCEVHWTRPYNAKAKPVERAFREFAENISKHPDFEGAYTGNGPTAKPENYSSKAIPLETFLKILDAGIEEHNAREGRRSSVAQGRSFNTIFDESYKQTTIRQLTSAQKGLLLLTPEHVNTARTDGSLWLAGNRYWTEKLSGYAGGKLIVRFDPQNLHAGVWVYDKTNRFVCFAPCRQPVGFADAQAAMEHQRNRRRFIKDKKRALESEKRMDAFEVAAVRPEGPPLEVPSQNNETPNPKVTELLFIKKVRQEQEEKKAIDERFTNTVMQMSGDQLKKIGDRFANQLPEANIS